MKTKNLSLLLTFSMFMATGCFMPEQSATTEPNTGTTSSGTDGNGNSDGNGDSTGGGSTGGSTGAYCSGTTSDGQGSGYPIHHYTLMAAGHQTWAPGTYSNALASETMPSIREASILFKSDNKLRVRFKIESQPNPTRGEEYCYGRETGQAADAFQYTKLRFRVALRDVKCDVPSSTNTNECSSGFYLGSRYRTQYISPISVNSCSNIIDFGPYRNYSPYGTVVEIDDVKSDSTCQYNNTNCPAEKIVRAASCWRMTMQVVTDYTQDFK